MKNILIFIYMFLSVVSLYGTLFLKQEEIFKLKNWYGVIANTLATIILFLVNLLPENFIVIKIIITSLFTIFIICFFILALIMLIVAKHRVEFNKDYIIILGCGIKDDGSLRRILKDRVNKAIEFYKNQLENTGKKAIIIPSGGQGKAEIISEAEAIKRYLLANGIGEEQIILEDKSTNTIQNLKYSKKIIENLSGSEKNIVFITSEYHLIRSIIFANKVGLKAECLGSRTKWYFLINALLRELGGMCFIALRCNENIKK